MSLSCYNRGCGLKYDEADNHDEACLHHPGLPYFHDAHKIWSCCQKKSIDFTVFLDLKGCIKSRHSNIPPEKPVKKVAPTIQHEELNHQNLSKQIVEERPSENLPLNKLKFSISSSLQPHLEKLEKSSIKHVDQEELLTIGTSCKNAGCSATYKSPEDNLEECIHHTGVPIFHEGMKFWSCCQKRTSDFDSFMQQEGCNTGKHLWIKSKDTNQDQDLSRTCRFDWFQTADQIVFNVYSKLPMPNLSLIQANPIKLVVSIVFGETRKQFYKQFILNGIIDLNESQVNYLINKTEITLKKSRPIQWPKLEFGKLN